MMSEAELIKVEVAFARPDKQKILEVLVPPGTTALQAAEQSGIVRHFPEIELEQATMGIFGQVLGTKGLGKPAEHVLVEGDRVEIYRPLIADPKEVRRRRAEKSKADKSA